MKSVFSPVRARRIQGERGIGRRSSSCAGRARKADAVEYRDVQCDRSAGAAHDLSVALKDEGLVQGAHGEPPLTFGLQTLREGQRSLLRSK
jgi:hypothetical protein